MPAKGSKRTKSMYKDEDVEVVEEEVEVKEVKEETDVVQTPRKSKVIHSATKRASKVATYSPRWSATKSKSGKRGKATKKVSLQTRTGLIFPIVRFKRKLKAGLFARRITKTAAIILAAAIEYLCAEMLELSGKAARVMAKRRKRATIKPRHIMLAVRRDPELDELLKGVTISESGVVPFIAAELIPEKSKRGRYTSAAQRIEHLEIPETQDTMEY